MRESYVGDEGFSLEIDDRRCYFLWLLCITAAKVISMRPITSPPIAMSKKTLGFDCDLAVAHPGCTTLSWASTFGGPPGGGGAARPVACIK